MKQEIKTVLEKDLVKGTWYKLFEEDNPPYMYAGRDKIDGHSVFVPSEDHSWATVRIVYRPNRVWYEVQAKKPSRWERFMHWLFDIN